MSQTIAEDLRDLREVIGLADVTPPERARLNHALNRVAGVAPSYHAKDCGIVGCEGCAPKTTEKMPWE